MSKQNVFKFPILKKIEINNFSLFEKQNNIIIDFKKGVFCLAGANGLGKSTFINIVNYALTGIVVNPKKSFTSSNSIPKFYNDSKKFADDYFEGRIDEENRDTAEVKLFFSVGEIEYQITRNFFEKDELREYSRISKVKSTKKEINATTPKDLNTKYMQELPLDIGLEEFDQFVFLQYYIFTFDESRQLLFWQPWIMERVLYIVFGFNAKHADALRKDINKLGSSVRNLGWDMTEIRKQISSVVDLLNNQKKTDGSYIDILDKHKELDEELEVILENIDDVENKLRDTLLQISDVALKLSALKNEYNDIFSKNFQNIDNISSHPIVVNSITNKICELCGNDSAEAIQNIKNINKSKCCPICDSKIIKSKPSVNVNVLKKLDSAIFEKTNQLKQLEITHQRLAIDHTKLMETSTNKKTELQEFEKQNQKILERRIFKDAKGVNELITTYQRQIKNIELRQREEKKKLEQKKLDLKKLEKSLKEGYNQAEDKFMPNFTKYAKNFLGLDINIYFQAYAKGANLALEVDNSNRRKAHQLSESQRYFIDIALRMSLINYFTQTAYILIDTPEGSLDIAYENRAGEMFADFSRQKYNIIMTANINTSQLLLRMAQKCGKDRMQLKRMTSWCILSDVQQAEEKNIERAYKAIENNLK